MNNQDLEAYNNVEITKILFHNAHKYLKNIQKKDIF